MSAKILVSEQVMMVDMADEVVILNTRNEHYYGLDDVSKDFWAWINEYKDIDLVLAKAVEVYPEDEIVIKRDLGEFTKQLMDAGLISFADEV